MSEVVTTARPAEAESAPKRRRAFGTVVYGGLIVALLDGLFALTFYGLVMGVSPLRIFQSVASGLLGREAFAGGAATFLLGVLLHAVVALCIAAVYYGLSLMLPILLRRPIAGGLIYGVVAYLGMNYVVIPLSRVGPGRGFVPYVFLTEALGHALLVGLPIALVARRFAGGGQSAD